MCQRTPLWVDSVSRQTSLLWIISIEEWPAPMTLLNWTSVWHRLCSEEEATAVPQALRCPAVQSERVPPSGWNLLGREISGNNICTLSRVPQNSRRDLEVLKFNPTKEFQCIQIVRWFPAHNTLLARQVYLWAQEFRTVTTKSYNNYLAALSLIRIPSEK